MKELILSIEIYKLDNGIRYESKDKYIEFIGDESSGNVISSNGHIGQYERDEFGDLWIDTDHDREFIGGRAIHYVIDALTK